MATRELVVSGSTRQDPLTAIEAWVATLDLKFHMSDHKRGDGGDRVLLEIEGDEAQIETFITELRHAGFEVE